MKTPINKSLFSRFMHDSVAELFTLIPSIKDLHPRHQNGHAALNDFVNYYFLNKEDEHIDIFPFGRFQWPRVELGKISSYSFFSLDELILFCFYFVNRKKYRVVFDVGANIGLHSVVLDRIGYETFSFEPDPVHYDYLVKHTTLNKCKNVKVFQKAISDSSGEKNFVRVKGNTTASHMEGSREFYGDYDTLTIATTTFEEIGVQPDLMKIDVEGHESRIIKSLDHKKWEKIDAVVEVHTEDNQKDIFNYFTGSNIKIYSQKNSWAQVRSLGDMPLSNKEGNIFISSKNRMPWGDEKA